MLGLLLCLALVYPVSCLVRGMVEEKETRMRETLCAPDAQTVETQKP